MSSYIVLAVLAFVVFRVVVALLRRSARADAYDDRGPARRVGMIALSSNPNLNNAIGTIYAWQLRLRSGISYADIMVRNQNNPSGGK